MNQHDPVSKSELRRAMGWSREFFDSLPLPRYPIGKRYYYKMADIEPTLERIKEVPWESTKSKGRPTTITLSPSKAKGIEEARERIKNRRLSKSTPPSGEEFS